MKKINLKEMRLFTERIEGTPVYDWIKMLVDENLIFEYFFTITGVEIAPTKTELFNELMDAQSIIFDYQMWNSYNSFSQQYNRYLKNKI